jgi:NAD(P)-dependent dehydrogenase (short-subunit alcohol dehydrogenase family)
MNKKIGVVGSSKGIGKAVAIAFAKSGEYYAVVTNARKLQEAQAVSDEIRTLGCNSIPIEADISKEADCVRLIEETVKNYNRIDVLKFCSRTYRSKKQQSIYGRKSCGGSYRTFRMQQRSCKAYGETTGSKWRLHHKYNFCTSIDTQATLHSICNFQSGS